MDITRELIQKTMEAKKYAYFENGDYNVNIIGIRNGSTGKRVTNRFDDWITISYKVKGEWNDQIMGDYGGQCMKDYLSAIDAVADEPFVDTTKLACVGASFGGYSVYWLAGHHQKRFKCFISHCGMFNMESWYGTTEEMFFRKVS